MKYKATLSILLLINILAVAEAEDRILFRFDQPESANRWQTVNDGVMGGRSEGRFKINNYKNLEFFGTLSLANNGGFASVRARGQALSMQKGEVIVARVRGDGRKYNFDLYSNSSRFSYRQSFQTKKGEWIEVEFPLEKSEASWRGRKFPGQTLNPNEVTGIGLILGDKKPGPFKLEVEWIRGRKAE